VVARVEGEGGINVLHKQSTEVTKLIRNIIQCYLVINICAQNKEAQSTCGIVTVLNHRSIADFSFKSDFVGMMMQW
jgi:hypothetical protein